jgi:hypothetical protein
VCLAVNFQSEKEWIKELGEQSVKVREWIKMSTDLIMMGGTDENDGAIVRNVKGASGSYLSEEYLGYYAPKYQRSFICQCWGHYGNP